MEKKKEKPIMTYDECGIVDTETEYRIDEAQQEQESELNNDDQEIIRKEVLEDSDVFERAYEDLTEYLTEVMQDMTKRNYYKDRWKATVNNFGWLKQNGFKTFKAENGKELLEAILPETDCTFKIFKDGRNGIKIQNYHHDSPMGNEWYYIKPMTTKEVEKEQGYC